MPYDANTIQTVQLLQRGGRYYVPADSGDGMIFRPTARGQNGSRVATLETLFDYFIDNVPNPDEAKTLDPDIETKLRMHPDVVSAMRKRVFTVASLPWRIDPNPSAPKERKAEAEEVAKYVADVWKKIPNLSSLYETLQEAVLVGGQGIEFMWHRDATGLEYPTSYQPVHISRFLFDRLGNMALLTRDQAVWGVYVSSNPQARYEKILPRGKFIYHVYRHGQGTWEKPHLEGYIYYGIGEDVSLYYPVTFDSFVLRFRLKLLEKYGIPPIVLYYPENRAWTSEMLRICDSLRGESLVTVPKLMGSGGDDNVNSLYKVDQLEVPKMNNDMFAEFSQNWTKPRIDAILLGSAEESQKMDGKGGYSDHVSRQDSGPNVWFRRDAQRISETISQQLIPAIVLARFPNLADKPEFWPVHVLEPKEEKDRQQEAQIIEAASKMVPVGEDYVYDALGVPKPEPGTKTIGGNAGAGLDDGLGLPGMHGAQPMGKPMVPGQPAQKAAIGQQGAQ